jgi:hypothetical protein
MAPQKQNKVFLVYDGSVIRPVVAPSVTWARKVVENVTHVSDEIAPTAADPGEYDLDGIQEVITKKQYHNLLTHMTTMSRRIWG